jgi:hypothetical protein
VNASEQIPEADVIEELAVEAAPLGRELERVDPQMGKIIIAEKPAEILAKATEIANELAKLIAAQDLARDVGGRKKHVEVGGWQALGALLGAFGGQPLHAETVWTRRLAGADGHPEVKTYHVKEVRKKWGKVDGRRQIIEEVESEYDVEGYDWEARVEVRTASGVPVGIAEAECSRAEFSWMQKPDPAVRSMAETRAESRAYRRAVGWLMAIAGYNPTPAEEMPAQEPEVAGPPFGPAAAPQIATSMRKAIAFSLDPENEKVPINGEEVTALLAQIEHHAGGYLPDHTARAVGHVAAAAKARRVAQFEADAAKPGEGDPAVETEDERLERERGEAVAAEHGGTNAA